MLFLQPLQLLLQPSPLSKRVEVLLLITNSSIQTYQKAKRYICLHAQKPFKKCLLRCWRMNILSKSKLLSRARGFFVSRTGRNEANGLFSHRSLSHPKKFFLLLYLYHLPVTSYFGRENQLQEAYTQVSYKEQ